MKPNTPPPTLGVAAWPRAVLLAKERYGTGVAELLLRQMGQLLYSGGMAGARDGLALIMITDDSNRWAGLLRGDSKRTRPTATLYRGSFGDDLEAQLTWEVVLSVELDEMTF